MPVTCPFLDHHLDASTERVEAPKLVIAVAVAVYSFLARHFVTPKGPRATSVSAMSPPIAVEPKLTDALPRLLHSFLAEHCRTPRELRALPVFAVHTASIAVGVLLLLA